VKITEDKRVEDAGAVPPGREDLTIAIVAHWDNTRRVLVRRRDKTVFSCLITQRQGQLWYITDFLPQRRDPELASMLLTLCDHLAIECGARQFITINPASWDEYLADAGARLLQRIVPMWTALDADLLLMHTKPLPSGYRITPLEVSIDELATLTQLSTDAERENDLRVWRDTFSGGYGPVDSDASLQIVNDSRLCAAITITEHAGAPLISHLVVAATERGHGLGSALLVEGLKQLSASGYVDCYLNVEEENWIAQRLYRSIGFIQRPTLRASHIRRRQGL
jgi:ribosomal protein S18 acetylase RimI-like enzyme